MTLVCSPELEQAPDGTGERHTQRAGGEELLNVRPSQEHRTT